MQKRLIRLLAALMAFSLVAAACGDDDDPVDAEPVEDEASDDEAADDEMADDEMADDEMADDEMADDEMDDDEMAEGEDEGPGTIVDVAVAAGSFETLVAAVQAADLVDTLSGDGPFTVFAPTDEAFAAALTDLGLTAEELLASEDLAGILTYHVVEGEVDAATAISLDGQTAATVNGAEISISVVDGSVVINDTATVTTADVAASNGIIHVIDAVLLPPA